MIAELELELKRRKKELEQVTTSLTIFHAQVVASSAPATIMDPVRRDVAQKNRSYARARDWRSHSLNRKENKELALTCEFSLQRRDSKPSTRSCSGRRRWRMRIRK